MLASSVRTGGLSPRPLPRQPARLYTRAMPTPFETPVAVTGATGFVGRHVVRALTAAGRPVRALARDLEKANETLPVSDLVTIVEGDLFNPGSLEELASGCGAFVHLVGIRREHRPTVTFDRLHVEATRRALAAAAAAGATRYLHMSALGARPAARSAYHQTKYTAETLVRDSALDWTIFRPSLVIGADGEFLEMARGWASGTENPRLFMPYFEPPRPHAKERLPAGVVEKPRVQPVDVDDVAGAFVRALENDDAVGEAYPLGGPRMYEWPELLEAIAKEVPGHTKPAWGVPAEVGQAVACAAQVARLDHVLPFSMSDVQMACEDNVCCTSKVEQELGLTAREVSFAG